MIFSMPLLRQRVRRPLGIGGLDGSDQGKYDDDTVDEYLNFSYRALLEEHAFREKEIVATVPTVVGKRNYTMPNPHDGLRQIDILDPVSQEHKRLEPMSVAEYTNRWTEGTDAYAKPERYVRENCLFRLFPTPDAVYTLTVRYWGILADIASNATSIDIPEIWIEPIIYGAVERAGFDLGNYPAASAASGLQKNRIERIPTIQPKEEEDWHEAGLEVKGREY